MKNILQFILIVLMVLYPLQVLAQNKEVCITEKDTIDLITLLDASERDLSIMESCESLVKELYGEVEARDEKNINVTNDLIQAKQDVIKYRAASTRWKKVAWYTSIGSAVMLVIQVAPLL